MPRQPLRSPACVATEVARDVSLNEAVQALYHQPLRDLINDLPLFCQNMPLFPGAGVEAIPKYL